MTLLEALIEHLKDRSAMPDARTVVFVFSEIDDENAYASEVPLSDLVPWLEEWCKLRRAEMRKVN